MNSYTVEWAVVTGASSGIGLEFAEIFAAQGINVVLAARGKKTLEDLAKKLELLGVKTLVFDGDLSDQVTVERLYARIKKEKLDVRYLINNAGFGDYGTVVDGDWDKYHKMINLNVFSLTYLTKVFASDMKKQGRGRILNVASTAAFFPGPLMAVYYATKAYVLRFSVAVNQELTGSGVTITTLCPGPTKTRFAKAANAQKTNIFATKNLPTAKVVAMFGYKAMMAGKPVAVQGRGNRFLTAFSGLLSPTFAARMVERFQG